MKYWKKLGSVLLALVMVMALAAPAFADNAVKDSGKNGEGTITITNANEKQDYEVWRVFEAVMDATDNDKVAYKPLVDPFPVNNYFTVSNGYITATEAATDENGDLSAGAIEWLAENYQEIGESITTVTPAETGAQKITGLPLGYYYVTTTTGTAVTVDTTHPDATITDKNPGTSIDKTITGVGDGSLDDDGENALAQVGTTVNYEVRIPIENGALNYVFTDSMDDGLTYSKDIKVYLVEDEDTEVADNATAESNYGTLTEEGNDIKIEFDNDWLADNKGVIVLQYSAVVNADAVNYISDGVNNTATISWGNGSLTSKDNAKVYTAKITVNKVDGDGDPLEGAGFILQDKDTGKYYKWDDQTNTVTWVDNIADAEEVMVTEVIIADDPETDEDETAKQMQAVFNGLANGTYVLIENTVPGGYNKADDVEITIKNSDVTYGNIAQVQNVVNQAGTVLPSTGGIGTTIFYVVGGVLVVGAVVLLITKRRTSVDDE